MGTGFTYRGSSGAWLGAFDAARRRASNGGGRRGWNGRARQLRARRRRGASGEQRQRWFGARSGKRRSWGASTCGGECCGLEPVTKRSPETRRRRAPRRGVRARVGKPLGGARERKDRGGGGEAHGEAVGGRQRARGGSRRRNGAAIDGGRAGKTSSGRPLQWLGAPTERWRWCSRGRRRRTTRRSGDWGTMAAGRTVNGGEHARAVGIEAERGRR